MSEQDDPGKLDPEVIEEDVEALEGTQRRKSLELLAPPTHSLKVPTPSGSGRNSPVHSHKDEITSSDGSLRSVRSARRALSPARLPSELVVKARSQSCRVRALTLHLDLVRDQSKEASAINAVLESAEEVHTAFLQGHSHLETVWPITHLDHEYFAGDTYTREASLICEIRQIVATRLQALNSTQPDHHSYRDATQISKKLPKLELPNFSGSYQEWTSFSSLFQSMVIDNAALTDLERLHYLRVSVTGPALELISHVPVTNTAFPLAWSALKERYGNQRVLTDTQLSALLHEHSVNPKHRESAEFLQQLISGVDSALNALTLIGQSTENWDCLVVYTTVKQFSTRTRELWEASVSTQTTYPTYAQLKEFVTQRARTLENTELSRLQSTSATQQKAKSSLTTTARNQTSGSSQQSSSTSNFQCDCCMGTHFISTCPKFRTLSPQDRKFVIIQRRICKNCMGRHNLSMCKSQSRCKTCNQNHHSMLHEAATSQGLPAATFKIQPRPFTNQDNH